jgi:ABC-2 type transport system permease protein
MHASVVEQAVSTAVQSVIIVLLGWAAGAHYPGGVAGVAVLVGASVVLGTVFGALSNAIGMLVRQRETIIGLNIFLLLPLTFLSSVFMADGLMPHWLRTLSAFNPLNWAVQAARAALTAAPDWGLVASRGAWLVALAVVAVWLSTRSFRAYQSSV